MAFICYLKVQLFFGAIFCLLRLERQNRRKTTQPDDNKAHKEKRVMLKEKAGC